MIISEPSKLNIHKRYCNYLGNKGIYSFEADKSNNGRTKKYSNNGKWFEQFSY
jgi:hypothetical protein